MADTHLLKTLVMRAVADDYEDLENILAQVSAWGMGQGLFLTKEQILDVLTGLLDAGLIKAYRLTPRSSEQIHGRPKPDVLPTCHFLLTAAGESLL